MKDIRVNEGFMFSEDDSTNIKLFVNKYHTWPSLLFSKDTCIFNNEILNKVKDDIYELFKDRLKESEVSFRNNKLQFGFLDGISFELFSSPTVYYSLENKDKAREVFKLIEDIYIANNIKDSGKYIYLVQQDTGGIVNTKQEVKRQNTLDITDNYNEDVLESHEIIVKHLNKKNTSGIILLHGEPGTGKTSYIRYLLENINKKLILINRHVAMELDGPHFTKFLINSCEDSVFLIEDAEELLISRNDQRNSAVSTLLNLSDGLLGDCLNINLICTFNAPKKSIDSAILRKGRLVQLVDFAPLTIDKANNLANKLGTGKTYSEPTKLTDVYNFKEKEVEFNKVNKVGFF